MLKKIIGSLCLFSLIAFVQAGENSNAFSTYMSPEGGISPISGTVALQKEIASISAGQIGTKFSLKYSGNVFKEATSANNESTSGLVGLGWSFGKSQIVCDCKENSFLDDDVYYLITAEGNRYQIFEEKAWRRRFGVEYDSAAKEKWWIEGNPFWSVERLVDSTILLGEGHHAWKYVRGWRITDAAGVVHTYGDVDELYSLTGPTSVGQATEYDLIWLKDEKNADAYGIMGSTYGGVPSYYPVAWNLSEEKSLDGNTLTYSYERISELLKGYFKNSAGEMDNWDSKIGYTKESYLKSVSASNGSHIDFFYENKGENQYKYEFVDDDGEYEKIGGAGFDMFKEKVQRKYLSSIQSYGPDNVYLGKVNFCYKAINEGTVRVKRLLSAIRFQNKNGNEVDYEEYSYFTNANSAMASSTETYAYPLGALYEVRGKSCGVVRYSYRTEPLGAGHVEDLPLDKVYGIGKLENGKSYLVGKLNKKLKIYTRILGRWVETVIPESPDADGNLVSVDDEVDRVDFGDSGWFMAVKNDKYARIFQWNGKEWTVPVTKKYSKTKYDHPFDFEDYKYQDVVSGPDYALLYTIDDDQWDTYNDEFLKVEVFWSKWKGIEDNFKKTFRDVADNNGAGYRIMASKNFIMIQFQTEWCSGNCMSYRVLAFRDGDFVDTKINGNTIVSGRDSENNIYMYGPWLFDVGEADHWYDDSRVQINGWNGSEWIRQLTYNFSNSDPLDVQSVGRDYVAARYNGNRHVRVFAFDGEKWDGSALHDKLFDYHLSKKFYWQGKGTEDFFVSTRSYRRRWFSETYENTRVKVYYHKNDQKWTADDYGWIDGFKYDEKQIESGSDWFVEKNATRLAWIWDGAKWKKENLNNKNYLDADFKDVYSLGGNVLAASKDGKTRLIYKINNSFVEPFGTFLVEEKMILEPVADRVIKYKYFFLPRENAENGVAFDESSNTPLMDVMKVELPNENGILERQLCGIRNGLENVATGLVCSEILWDNRENTKITQTKTSYKRVRSNWPYPVFLDQEQSRVSISRGLKNVVQNTYSEKNGMLTKVVKSIGNRKNEENFVFISDLEKLGETESKIAEVLKKVNRLTLPVGNYACVPNCESGSVVAASATGYTDVKGIKTATSSWKFTPKERVSEKTLRTQMIDIAFNNKLNKNWERQSFNSAYMNNQVVETEEGPKNIKMASFVENKEGGKLLGVAAKCGIDEGLMLSGESCNIRNWIGCETMSLTGFSINTLSPGFNDFSSYGRFSKKVIKLISGTALEGKIPSAKDEDYKFTAWMQYRPEKGSLVLSVNGSTVANWETYPASITADSIGHWKRIEWIGKIGSNQKISFEARNISSEIRLQDIRILPVSAVSTVNYWDEEWNKIQSTVDSRGIGSYVSFDELGRETEQYSETDDGSVYLSAKTSYADGNCSAFPNGSDRLSALFLNGKAQKIPSENENRTSTYVLDEANVYVDFLPVVHNEGVVYRLYEEGSQPGDWRSPGCGAMCYPSFSFSKGKNSWILEVDVVPYGENSKYVFNLKKKENDWVEYGDYNGFALGDLPKYRNVYDQSSVVYQNKKGKIDTAKFNGNDWIVDYALNEQVSEFTTFTGYNGSFISYVSAEELPVNRDYLNYPKVFKVINSGLELFDISDKKFRADNIVLSQNSNNNLVMLYNTNGRIGTVERVENGEVVETHEGFVQDESLYAMEWDPSNKDFVYMGSLPEFTYAKGEVDIAQRKVSFSTGNITSYRKGMVNDYPAMVSDAVVGPEGKMYVAYIGESSFFNVKSSNENDDVGVPLVYVKRLYSSWEVPAVTEDIWAGPSQIGDIPLYQGDILSWSDNVYDAIDGAKKIKLDYDGTNLYLAVSYMLNESDDEIEKSNQLNKPSMSMTVFKGSFEYNKTVNEQTYSRYLKWSPLKDNSIKTVQYAKTVAEEQTRVAYLSENDDFNFIVRNGVPYILFSNENNNGGISVIKYDGNRWTSVGNPSFAYPEKSVASANLGVNYEGSPFVVFKADNSIHNNDREYKIVGMHYNNINALDLTLSDFETANEAFNKSCAFRQYILNYSADLNEDEYFTFKVAPRTPGHVKEIQIVSNKKYLMSVQNFAQDITLPLSEGLNNLEVRVVGHDNRTLSYNFDLYRFYKEIPGLTFGGLTTKSTFTYKEGSLDSDAPEGFDIDIDPLTIRDDRTVSVDIHVPLGWELTLVIDGNPETYSVSTTVLIPVDALPLTGGYLFNTQTGKIIPVKIKNVNDIKDPSDIVWYEYPFSSSSSSSENQDEGSTSNIVNKDMSENVPIEVRNVSTATIFASGDVYLADNVSVKGDVFAGRSLNIGVTTSAKNNVYSGGSVKLRNRAEVDNVYYVSNLEVMDGAKYSSASKLSMMNVSTLPTYSFATGKTPITVENGKTLDLTNGFYGDFTARTGTSISFERGDYYFNSFYTDSDVKLNFAPGTRIWVRENLRIGNGCKLFHSGKVGDLFIYVDGEVSVETNVELHAVLLAPNANIAFSTGLHIFGYVFSSGFNIQPNSVIE